MRNFGVHLLVIDRIHFFFQVSKNQYHCDGCGICRLGFFNPHSISLFWSHVLVIILSGWSLLSFCILFYFFTELQVRRTSSTAIVVVCCFFLHIFFVIGIFNLRLSKFTYYGLWYQFQDVAIAHHWRIHTIVWKEQCTTTARFALRYAFLINYLILQSAITNIPQIWCSLIVLSVSFWVDKGHKCIALWSHNTFGMLEGDEAAFPVSKHEECISW